MKAKIYIGAIALFITLQVNYSCKKEYSCEGCGVVPLQSGNNLPPIAMAGPDQVVTLPADSILLDGSASNDPDGTISDWLWKRISGPASSQIVNSATTRTIAKNLTVGVYQFELKVTDDKGLIARDTMQVVVNDPTQPNRPPVANAGPDQAITLPTNAVTLDGSASSDPDNNITSYLWTKISGPAASTIANPAAVQTVVTNLTEGLYGFELKVTDSDGLYSMDTMKVIVSHMQPPPPVCGNNRPMINLRLLPVGLLSEARMGCNTAAAGNKLVFAGGWGSGSHSSRVDIFNLTENTWTTAELCVPRTAMAAVSSGDRLFFAGGETGDGTWPVDSVDIFNVNTNTWTVSHLSTAGSCIVGTAVGNKLLFAGGDGGFTGPGRETRVDIYDLATNSWSTATLSDLKRGFHAAVTSGNKVYFAGGETWDGSVWKASDVIDIYDNVTNTWSVAHLNQGKMFLTGIMAANKIYWAGGSTGISPNMQSTCTVEIMDVASGTSTVQYLFEPAGWDEYFGQKSVMLDNKIIYYRPGGTNANKCDIYDHVTNSWAIGILPQPIPGGASIVSHNNAVYIAGGTVNGVLSRQVWKLEF